MLDRCSFPFSSVLIIIAQLCNMHTIKRVTDHVWLSENILVLLTIVSSVFLSSFFLLLLHMFIYVSLPI